MREAEASKLRHRAPTLSEIPKVRTEPRALAALEGGALVHGAR
jgi:hypothetical protein